MQLLSTFFRKNSIEKGLKQVKKKIQKKILTGFLDNSLCNIHVYPLEKRRRKLLKNIPLKYYEKKINLLLLQIWHVDNILSFYSLGFYILTFVQFFLKNKSWFSIHLDFYTLF